MTEHFVFNSLFRIWSHHIQENLRKNSIQKSENVLKLTEIKFISFKNIYKVYYYCNSIHYARGNRNYLSSRLNSYILN